MQCSQRTTVINITASLDGRACTRTQKRINKTESYVAIDKGAREETDIAQKLRRGAVRSVFSHILRVRDGSISCDCIPASSAIISGPICVGLGFAGVPVPITLGPHSLVAGLDSIFGRGRVRKREFTQILPKTNDSRSLYFSSLGFSKPFRGRVENSEFYLSKSLL